MWSHHQPQQIVNERPIRCHANVFGPRPLNVLDFDYATMAFVYIVFVGTPDSHFASILPKIKEKREKSILS